MSVAGPPTPEADLSTNEDKQERSYQAFVAALDLRDKIREYVLFPPEFDFTKAAFSSYECGSKIAKLMEFEIEIKSKKQLVMKHHSQLENKELLCLKLSFAASWSKRIFDIFHKELKEVSESGAAITHEKSISANNFGDMYMKMQRMLVDYDLVYTPPEEKEHYIEEPFVTDDERYDIFREINTGRFYYRDTKAKDTAFGFLKEIEDIEIDHDKEKKKAVAQKKVLDPSKSKNYIEQQIELVMKLPVQELKFELEELIPEIHPRLYHITMNREVLDYISNQCYVMIKKMKEFWKESPKGKEHISNGWEQILASLIYEVKSFEEKWEKVYAPYFSPRDRSDRKRQATK